MFYKGSFSKGIPENEYQNVVKPFYRIDKSRSQNKSGVGLGLSIVQRIVSEHYGRILIDSKPGETVFKVRLKKRP